MKYLLNLCIAFMPAIASAQVINLVCKTDGGRDWGSIVIDLKKKTIVETNILQKLSAEEYERWLQKYQKEQGKAYTPIPFDPVKSAARFNITKSTDEIIYGESHSWTFTDIEINRYSLQMRYPSSPGYDRFQCSKIEKAF